MDFSIITKPDLLKAGKSIDFEGIPVKFISNNYWIELPNQREYPFKYLTREAYKIANNTEENLEFKSTEPNRKYIKDLNLKLNYYSHNLNFFKKYEIEDFSHVAGKKYRKDNPENVRYSKLILPLVKKLNYWAASSLIEDFVFQEDNKWQWSGTFKKYLWIRIYRKNDSKSVYFVLGVNEQGELNVHLNCQRSNHTKGSFKPLPDMKIKAFDEYLRESDYSDKRISKNRLSNYSWESLIEYTQNHFYQYASLYDELEALTKDTSSSKKSDSNFLSLTPNDAPDKTKSYLNRKRGFKGKNINWSKKQFISSKLGLLGEELVIHNEKLKLEKIGLVNKAEKVAKKKDGEGYDILSFDDKKNEVFIEVKTTTGSIDEPFYISANEKIFCEENSEQYVIYRLYNYDYLNKSASFYKIKGTEISKFEFTPTNFEVSKN